MLIAASNFVDALNVAIDRRCEREVFAHRPSRRKRKVPAIRTRLRQGPT